MLKRVRPVAALCPKCAQAATIWKNFAQRLQEGLGVQADEEQRASGCLGLFPGLVHGLEKLRRLQAESSNDFEDVYQCQIVLASFDAAHLAAVNATGIPEGFLRIAQCLAMLSSSKPEAIAVAKSFSRAWGTLSVLGRGAVKRGIRALRFGRWIQRHKPLSDC